MKRAAIYPLNRLFIEDDNRMFNLLTLIFTSMFLCSFESATGSSSFVDILDDFSLVFVVCVDMGITTIVLATTKCSSCGGFSISAEC